MGNLRVDPENIDRCDVVPTLPKSVRVVCAAQPRQVAVAAGQGEWSGLANRPDMAGKGAEYHSRTKRHSRSRRPAPVEAEFPASLVLYFSRYGHQERATDRLGGWEFCGDLLLSLQSDSN